MNKLPIKFAVLNSFIDEDRLNLNEVYDKLKKHYENEKQFTKENILEHILSLRANDLLNEKYMDIDRANNLVIYYEITKDGVSTVKKYIIKNTSK